MQEFRPNACHHSLEYRDPEAAQALVRRIAEAVESTREYRFMEFCGGHTHVLARWGLTDLLPANVHMIHGPGCPVCVLPISRIDMALEVAQREAVTLCTYADLMRVPASRRRTLIQAKAQGADIRMVTSPLEALQFAKAHPEREVVFFAIGFETTAPATAATVKAAAVAGVTNFTILASHVLTIPAVDHVLSGTLGLMGAHPPTKLNGIVGPAHVSTITGETPWADVVQRHHIPCVICGFEPLDMLLSIWMLVRQVNAGEAKLENEFVRGVSEQGNPVAQALLKEVFVLRENFTWRGLGVLPKSALALSPTWQAFDAEERFHLLEKPVLEPQGCACGAILRGDATPLDCRLFGRVCTPAHPIGACMVSSEGACAAEWTYGTHDMPVRASGKE